jgi:hypothetical protein
LADSACEGLALVSETITRTGGGEPLEPGHVAFGAHR